jgi:SAM-dependent methyltransferase
MWGRRDASVMIARFVEAFPFITATELEAAQARWELQLPGSAASGLFQNLEGVLADPSFRSALDLGLASNLFQVQGILFEASLAFRLSGDSRYLEPVQRCINDISDERRRRERLPNEVYSAFVVVGLTVAHALCGEAIDADLLMATVATVTAELSAAADREEWGDRLPKRNAWNHTAVGYAAIGCGGLLCRESDPRAQRWLTSAIERLGLFFADGVTDAGMTREGLSYCGFAFRNLAPLLLACRNAGIWDYRSPQDNPYVERLRRVPRWYAMETLPGGSWQQTVNDSYWSPRRAMWGFLPTFGALDPVLTAWVYDMLLGSRGNGSHGADRSLSASSLFESVLWMPSPAPDGSVIDLPEVLDDAVIGYIAERVREAPRSGFSFNCGEYLGGIHDQSDNGSITLFAEDVPLLIDSGAANQPVEGSSSSSQGHSLVLIAGREQCPPGGGAGCSGKIVQAERHAQATVITADLAASYAQRGYNPIRHAIRHCVFGKHPFTYMLIVDDFSRPRGEQATFEQLFHTPPVVESSIAGSELQLRIEFEGARCSLAIRPLDEDVEVEQTSFTQHDPALFAEHPVWRLRRKGGHVIMPTLLLPHETGRAPEVSASFDVRAGRVVLHWKVAETSGVDLLEFTPGSLTAARLTRDGVALAGTEPLLEQPEVHVPVTVSMDELALRRRRHLRRLVESVESFEDDAGLGISPPAAGDDQDVRVPPGRVGRELLEHLVTLAGLDPDDSVLDIECGMGDVAAPLVHYLRYGSYLGFDAREESIAWCRGQITPRNPRFSFEHFDVYRTGPARETTVHRLPYQDEYFDCIVARSVLDTAREQEVEVYLREFARVLRDDGVVFLTASLEQHPPAVERLWKSSPHRSESSAKLVIDRVAFRAMSDIGPLLQSDILVLRRKR